MKLTYFKSLAVACCLPLLSTGVANASLVVVGSLQTEQGDAGDWDPSISSLVMTDEGGGIHTYTANNLVDGDFYVFKVLDDEGTPPAAWGDPEPVNADTMTYGDSDGSVGIWVNTNETNGHGGNVVWVNTDNAPLQVVGSFMVAAGGATDWDPSDPAFAMTPQGDGYYTYDMVVASPGNYEFKVTNGAVDGADWQYQLGPDGFGANANTHAFSTTAPNESVTLYVDLAGRAIGVVPEPASALLVAVALAAVPMRRRTR